MWSPEPSPQLFSHITKDKFYWQGQVFSHVTELICCFRTLPFSSSSTKLRDEVPVVPWLGPRSVLYPSMDDCDARSLNVAYKNFFGCRVTYKRTAVKSYAKRELLIVEAITIDEDWRGAYGGLKRLRPGCRRQLNPN